LTANEVEKFIKDWNNREASKYRTHRSLRYDGINSSSLLNKIVIFEKNRKLRYTGFISSVYDNSNWTYRISQANNFDYFHALWEGKVSEKSRSSSGERTISLKKMRRLVNSQELNLNDANTVLNN